MEPEMTKHLQKYIQYIRNTARVPLKVEQFDDDWEPVGPMVRRDLLNAGLIKEVDGGIVISEEPPHAD